MRVKKMMIYAMSAAMSLSAVLCPEVCAAQAPQPRQTVGLVLSGGGAKGIAEIGVIKVLEENNIPIDYITGTSMGAIVGALYACGYTPDEMMQLLASPEFASWSSGQIDQNLTYYFAQPHKTSAMVSVPLAIGHDSVSVGQVLPVSLISPLPMNFAFMDLFSKYTAQCNQNFDNLFVPYRSVCSDVAANHKKVMRSGQLADAVRASMSFPMVFHPIMVDSVLLYDGGIYDNFPTDVMRADFKPDIMIGVNVSGPNTKEQETSLNLFDQLECLIMRPSDYSLPQDEGVLVKVHVSEFSLLDWDKGAEIYAKGYQRALEMLDTIKQRVHARRSADEVAARRAAFKARTPSVRFDDVYTIGGQPKENEYISYLFSSSAPRQRDYFDIDEARLAYYRALSSERLNNLEPQALYNDTTGMFTLELKASPRHDYHAGVGGYITSSTNSYIYLDAGYSALRFNSLNANIGAWFGQSYLAGQLNAGWNMRSHLPSTLGLEVVAWRRKYYQSDYLFYEDKAPTFIINNEVFGRVHWSCAATRRGMFDGSLGWGYLYDSFYPSDQWTTDHDLPKDIDRDHTRYHLGQVRVAFDYNTLNSEAFPTTGHQHKAVAMGIIGNYQYRPAAEDAPRQSGHVKWTQLELQTRNYWAFGKHWGTGVEGQALLSTRKLLHDYNATIVQAPAFTPTPVADNAFNPAFRANSWVAAGVTPYWQPVSKLTARLSANVFLPLRKIEMGPQCQARYGRWLSNPEFYGEFSLSFNLSVATLAGYVNYQTYPAHNWNCGLTFGLYLPAPRFLR